MGATTEPSLAVRSDSEDIAADKPLYPRVLSSPRAAAQRATPEGPTALEPASLAGDFTAITAGGFFSILLRRLRCPLKHRPGPTRH